MAIRPFSERAQERALSQPSRESSNEKKDLARDRRAGGHVGRLRRRAGTPGVLPSGRHRRVLTIVGRAGASLRDAPDFFSGNGESQSAASSFFCFAARRRLFFATAFFFD